MSEKKKLTSSSSKNTKKSSGKNAVIDFSAQPQVNLLPQEIVDRRGLSALKVRIGYSFIAVFVVIGLGFAFVHLEKANAESRHEDAVAETARLKQEEKKYDEVPRVLGQISASESALRDGMYREILWSDYLGAIAGTVPDNGIIKSLTVEAATMNTVGPVNQDGLQETSVGELSFAVNFEELPDTSTWITELNAIPGFADSRLSNATHFLSPDGDETIEFVGTVRLLESAYSHRFEPVEEEVQD